MKKLLLTVSLLFIVTLGVLAQSTSRDEVHLKNGSIIKGEVLGYESEPENTIRVQTSDGSIFVFKMSEVLNVRKTTNDTNYNVKTNAQKAHFREGYKGFFETGFSFGVGDYGVDFFSATTSHGYQFNPYFFLGAGFGINVYTEGYGSTPIAIPVFLNPRFNLLDNFITPYLDLKIGYSFVDTDHFYFNPAIGGSISLNEKIGMNFSVGYTMQLLEGYEYTNYQWSEATFTSSGIMLRLGLEF